MLFRSKETYKANFRAEQGFGLRVFNTYFQPNTWKEGWYHLIVRAPFNVAIYGELLNHFERDTFNICNTQIPRKLVIETLNRIYSELQECNLPDYRALRNDNKYNLLFNFSKIFDACHEKIKLNHILEKKFLLYCRLARLIIFENSKDNYLQGRKYLTFNIHVINKNEK